VNVRTGMGAEVGHRGEGTAGESQERVERAGGGEDDGEEVAERMWRGVVVESDVESGPTRWRAHARRVRRPGGMRCGW
jgi:hypothetical protein